MTHRTLSEAVAIRAADRLVLTEAAMALREEAHVIRGSHTPAPDYVWTDEESFAKATYDRLISLASKVTEIAERGLR